MVKLHCNITWAHLHNWTTSLILLLGSKHAIGIRSLPSHALDALPSDWIRVFDTYICWLKAHLKTPYASKVLTWFHFFLPNHSLSYNKLPLWQICICNKCDLCISHMTSSTQINNPIISGISLSLHCCYIEHLVFIGVVAIEHPNLLHIFVVYSTSLECGYLYHNKNIFWKVDLDIFSHCKKRILKMYPLLDNW